MFWVHTLASRPLTTTPNGRYKYNDFIDKVSEVKKMLK